MDTQAPIKYDFNGGKLFHIFQTESQGRNLVYTDQFLNEDAKLAFTQGKGILKIDGECCAIHLEETEHGYMWRFYRRQDNYKGSESTMPLPDGAQLDTYDQGGKPHHYCFLPMKVGYATGKGSSRSLVGFNTYQAISNGVKLGLIPDPNDSNAPEWITCEWVGTKHQKNMDGIPYEHAIVPHYEPFLPQISASDFEGFKAMAREECFEGVVFQSPVTNKRYKLRTNMMPEGIIWDCENKKKKPSGPNVTTIRPLKVLTKDGCLTWNGSEWKLEQL